MKIVYLIEKDLYILIDNIYNNSEDKLNEINYNVLKNIELNAQINNELFIQKEIIDDIDKEIDTNMLFINESKKLLNYFVKSIYKDKCTMVLSILIILLVITIIIVSIVNKK